MYEALDENFDVALEVAKDTDKKSRDLVLSKTKKFTVMDKAQNEAFRELSNPVAEDYVKSVGAPGQKIIDLLKE